MADLPVQSREYDLPPKWDGWPVEWEPWRDTPEVFICPPPKDREPCVACGSITRSVETSGTVTADMPDDVTSIGRANLRDRVLRWRLHVFRCPDCRHDTVLDLRRDEWWELDYTDYGADGSGDPEVAP